MYNLSLTDFIYCFIFSGRLWLLTEWNNRLFGIDSVSADTTVAVAQKPDFKVESGGSGGSTGIIALLLLPLAMLRRRFK